MASPRSPMDLLSPTDVRRLLQDHGLHPSRALGQNFLADPNTARRIVRLAGVAPGDRVLEIGPGIGSLTLALAGVISPPGGPVMPGDPGTAGLSPGRSGELIALELDRHLLPVLDEVLDGHTGVRVVSGDAMTADYDALLGATGPDDRPWQVVANLPYNVATPLVAHLLEAVPQLARIVVMVQREVAQRLAAPPGTSACGAISTKVAYYARAKLLTMVPATVFIPRPNVESAVVAFDRHATPPIPGLAPEPMLSLARAGFAQRRKMLRQSLKPVLGDAAEATLLAAGLDPAARAETLTLAGWAALARVVETGPSREVSPDPAPRPRTPPDSLAGGEP